MKKFMTLAEQLDAINHADEASMMAYLEGCANPHFLALSNVVASGNVNVIDEIIEMEELHTLVIRTMMAVLPDEMHHLVRNHKSYKEIDANIVFPGSRETFIEMMLNLNVLTSRSMMLTVRSGLRSSTKSTPTRSGRWMLSSVAVFRTLLFLS